MKTVNHKSLILSCILVILLTSVSPVMAYPPDNAAVLYYRSFLIMKEPGEDLNKMLTDLRKGSIKPNDEIRQHLQQNQSVIELLETASNIPNCDWGRDISEGFDLLMPELSKLRQMAFMLIADAQVLSEKGDYKTALKRCLTVHKMSRHVGDDLLISYLVGVALNTTANERTKEILSGMPGDLETLTLLKNQIFEISNKATTIKAAISKEKEICLQEMRKEKIDTILQALKDEYIDSLIPKDSADRIRKADEEFFRASREYYMGFMTGVQAALDLPYPQSRNRLDELNEKAKKDVAENPAAILTASLSSAVGKISSIEVRNKTFFNANIAAIDIYIVKAKTGRLPDTLPADLPRDLYSGKDFEYEKTKDGFILRCRGRDLDKDEIHQYEFKVPK